MCIIAAAPIATAYSTRMLLAQAALGLNPGSIYLLTKVRRAEIGLTHPHFSLPKLHALWNERIPLGSINKSSAILLLAWATWLCLCNDLSTPEDPTEVEIALLVSCLEREALMEARIDVLGIAQFISRYYTHSISWPF